MTFRSMRSWRRSILAGGALAAGALVLADSGGGVSRTIAAASKPQPASHPAPADGKLGFVVTYFYNAMYQGDEACPKGMTPILSSKDFVAQFSPEERERLLRRENARELFTKMVQRGPNGENVCKNPEAAPDPQMLTLAGARNDGLDLDRVKDEKASTAYTCPHTQFVGDDGGAGVDNQLGRIYACISGFREKGTLTPYFTETMRNGMWSMLIDLSGVDDVRNDREVTVDIYAGEDHMVKDPGGNVIAGASLAPKTDPKFHRTFKGRITNGVLETETIDNLLMPDLRLSNRQPPTLVERPRFRLTLAEDGTAKGYLGGYQAIKTLMIPEANGNSEQFMGLQCNGLYHALKKYADGGRDANGQCQTISTAYRIEAVRAYIVRPDRKSIRTFAEAK